GGRNDEGAELAVALNQMTSRLGAARDALTCANAELEDRVVAATRNVSALYDTTRAITSTLDPADVLRLMEERVRAARSRGRCRHPYARRSPAPRCCRCR